MTKQLISISIAFLILGLISAGPTAAVAATNADLNKVQIYEVNKKVKDFDAEDDFSRPESAYAAMNRLCAGGEVGRWRQVSVKRLAERMPAAGTKIKVLEQAADEWQNALILEVRIFDKTYAAVLAKIPHPRKSIIDYRALELVNGRWLNAGNGVFSSMHQARKEFDIVCQRYQKRPKRPKIEDPEEYLRPFVDFLKTEGKPPKVFVTEALAAHKVVIIGETHHRPRYWAFNSSLVADPHFSKLVGTIYMELPSNHQHATDKFLSAEECNTMPVIRMLRDMLWMGWPDQPMLDFFVTVWRTNEKLEPEHRLRIVLVDMQRPWEKITTRADWKLYDVDRDKYMADNIVRDIQDNPHRRRNSLFIVGIGHAALDFESSGGKPIRTAGWRLRERLGRENVYAIMQHRCVMTNMGRVDGRLCLGLFDSAFEAVDHKPMAFALGHGPFGQESYDAQPDMPAWSSYGDGFNRYLCLGPLETEIFSPLIAGFYTDEFVRELDRRYRIMFGTDLKKGWRLASLDGRSFAEWMGKNWGQRRNWAGSLGPMDAWKERDDWEQKFRKAKYEWVLKNPQVIEEAAQQLFESIRAADYDSFLDPNGHVVAWGQFPTVGRYKARQWHGRLVEWICRTFKENPIESIRIGEVLETEAGLPGFPYELTLRDAKKLEGTLPFEYSGLEDRWWAIEGIDWHLRESAGP
ncbi:MAG: hypothetical protein ACYTEL_17030 [Planctomycetota bacterium]